MTVLRVDARGNAYLGDKPKKLFALMRVLRTLQSKGTPQGIRLVVDPRAPFRKVLVIQSLLKESRLPFETRTQPFRASSRPTSRPAMARNQPAPQPTRQRPTPPRVSAQATPSKPQKPRATPAPRPATSDRKGPTPAQLPWQSVPTQTVASLREGQRVELRLLAVNKAGAGIPAALTGLIYYENGKRRPVGRQATNDRGLARYIFRFRKNSRKDFRVAVLNDTHLYEFPVPLKQVSGGLLYLRMNLNAGSKKASKKTTRKSAPALRTSSPLLALEGQDWRAVPLSKSLRGDKGRVVEYRVQLVVDGKPLAGAPTGLLLGKGKQRGTPIGRLRADKQGRLRYQVKARSGIWYGLAVMLDGNNPSPRSLKLRSLPLPAAGESIKYIRLRFRSKRSPARAKRSTAASPHGKKNPKSANKTGNFLFQGLHLLVEPFDPYHVRVTTFVTLLRPMSPSFDKMPQFPLSWGAKKTTLGPQLGKLSPEVKGLSIVARRLPARPRMQLSYSYLVPINPSNETIRIKVKPEYTLVRGSLFLHPKLALKTDLGKKIRDITSRGKRKQVYGLYALSKAKKGKFLAVTLGNKTKYQRGFLGWVRRTYKSRKRYKLLGLGVLFSFSVLGLFLLAGGRREDADPVTQSEPISPVEEEEKSEEEEEKSEEEETAAEKPAAKPEEETVEDLEERSED